MTPFELYQQQLNQPSIQPDEEQRHAVQQCERLYYQLNSHHQSSSWFSKLFNKPEDIKGLYLWGGTGRGKTWIVDSFYSCLEFKDKQRTHFHSFMRDVHQSLRTLPKTPDPLKIIATGIAKKTRLLCLDEFHVHDIGDAMIMAGLLEALFKQRITLVATSNIPIEDLYLNGLQRDRFMDTITALQYYTQEVNLGQGTDYRFKSLNKSGTYFIGDSNEAETFLNKHLTQIAPCPPKHNRQLTINHRGINYIAYANNIIWFSFEQICNTPRADSDYIALANLCQTIMISDVSYMDEQHDNIARRFIHLIDALYDHQVKCIITAVDKPENLYRGKSLAKPFQRTISRLVEMDSSEYLKLPHRMTESTM